MIKGASIALIALVLGAALGNRFTIWHFESVAKAYVSGQAAKK